MTQYSSLAGLYDCLTDNVSYEEYAAQIERLFRRYRQKPSIVLELACGTGSLTRLLAQRGYEMIAADISPDMLTVAREKCGDLPVPPVFICQDMCELDLYGTVQAAVCCLDSVNYLTDRRQLRRAFSRVSLFLEQGGLFLFDVKTPALFRAMDGLCSVDEGEGWFSAWRYGWDGRSRLCVHQVDLFFEQHGGYQRRTEEHVQRAYPREVLEQVLAETGFSLRGVFQGLSLHPAQEETGRLFFAAQKQSPTGTINGKK